MLGSEESSAPCAASLFLAVLATSSTGPLNASRTTCFFPAAWCRCGRGAGGRHLHLRSGEPQHGAPVVVRVISRDRKKTVSHEIDAPVEPVGEGNLGNASITLSETAAGAPPKVKA